MADRVTVFIDWQNAYRTARQSFFDPKNDPHTHGQFDPIALAKLVTNQGPSKGQRTLSEVRVYTGRPSSTKDPKSSSAHMKQCAAWQANGATVIARPLRYPSGWPEDKAREKGIDVRLAVDFVAMAIENQYDTGILFSVDTDLIPALEFVARRRSPPKTVEAVAWDSPNANRRLAVPGMSIWCHKLNRAAFDTLADMHNYAA